MSKKNNRYRKDDPSTSAEDDVEDEHDEDEQDEEKGEGHRTHESRWEDAFHRLVEFKRIHGHCNVPFRYVGDPHLGRWVSLQRSVYKGEANNATNDRVARLNDLGFDWAPKDPRYVSWENRYAELAAYVKKYGNAKVPLGWKENVQLANWVSAQRREYKLLEEGNPSRLTPERITALNKINFVWKVQSRGSKRSRGRTDNEGGTESESDMDRKPSAVKSPRRSSRASTESTSHDLSNSSNNNNSNNNDIAAHEVPQPLWIPANATAAQAAPLTGQRSIADSSAAIQTVPSAYMTFQPNAQSVLAYQPNAQPVLAFQQGTQPVVGLQPVAFLSNRQYTPSLFAQFANSQQVDSALMMQLPQLLHAAGGTGYLPPQQQASIPAIAQFTNNHNNNNGAAPPMTSLAQEQRPEVASAATAPATAANNILSLLALLNNSGQATASGATPIAVSSNPSVAQTAAPVAPSIHANTLGLLANMGLLGTTAAAAQQQAGVEASPQQQLMMMHQLQQYSLAAVAAAAAPPPPSVSNHQQHAAVALMQALAGGSQQQQQQHQQQIPRCLRDDQNDSDEED